MHPLKTLIGWFSGGDVRRRIIASVGGTLLAGVFGVLPNSSGVWIAVDVVGVVLGLGLTALGVAASSERERNLRDVAEEAAQDAKLALSDVVAPVLDKLGELFRQSRNSTNCARYKESIISGIVSALATIIGPDRSRACFFDLVETEQGRLLRPRPGAYYGRSTSPKTIFREGTIAGDAALDLVDSNAHLFCDNVENKPPRGWSGPHEYKAFISVAVRQGSQSFGMLTIDALEADVLTEASGLPTTMILARMLSIALAY